MRSDGTIPVETSSSQAASHQVSSQTDAGITPKCLSDSIATDIHMDVKSVLIKNAGIILCTSFGGTLLFCLVLYITQRRQHTRNG